MGQDEEISDEALRAALDKVLEDVPALKPQAPEATGFIQVGVASGQQQTANEPMALRDAISIALRR